MSEFEIEQHKIVPGALFDAYDEGYRQIADSAGKEVSEVMYPVDLVADYYNYQNAPHMLSAWILRKWFNEGKKQSIVDNCENGLVATNE